MALQPFQIARAYQVLEEYYYVQRQISEAELRGAFESQSNRVVGFNLPEFERKFAGNLECGSESFKKNYRITPDVGGLSTTNNVSVEMKASELVLTMRFPIPSICSHQNDSFPCLLSEPRDI